MSHRSTADHPSIAHCADAIPFLKSRDHADPEEREVDEAAQKHIEGRAE